MSTIERSKGRLIPVTDNPTLCFADFDTLYDMGMFRLNGKEYKVEWEVHSEKDCSYFADVKENPDGSIDFHTLHYNGGAYWTEVIEDALRENK